MHGLLYLLLFLATVAGLAVHPFPSIKRGGSDPSVVESRRNVAEKPSTSDAHAPKKGI